MMRLAVAFLCTSAATAVTVVPEVLSASEADQLAADDSLPVASNVHVRTKTVSLDDRAANHLLGRIRSGTDCDVSRCDLDLGKNIQVSSTSTFNMPATVEYKDEESEEEYLGEYAFVFLNEDKGVVFRQGSTLVPAQKGTLVTYSAEEEHETTIPRGKSAHILGPFKVLEESRRVLKKKKTTKKKSSSSSSSSSAKKANKSKKGDRLKAPEPEPDSVDEASDNIEIDTGGLGCKLVYTADGIVSNGKCGDVTVDDPPPPPPEEEPVVEAGDSNTTDLVLEVPDGGSEPEGDGDSGSLGDGLPCNVVCVMEGTVNHCHCAT